MTVSPAASEQWLKDLERATSRFARREPPVGEDAVTAFEHEHGVELPEPYRTYLAYVGNGASGPAYYGVENLGAAPPGSYHFLRPGLLRESFPLTEAWVWEDDAEFDQFQAEHDVEAGRAAPDSKAARFMATHRAGTLHLGTDGCGMDYQLVVTGPARGQVWMVSGEGAMPVAEDFQAWLDGNLYPDADWTLESRRNGVSEDSEPERGLLARLRGLFT
jgi:hypothetical protein